MDSNNVGTSGWTVIYENSIIEYDIAVRQFIKGEALQSSAVSYQDLNFFKWKKEKQDQLKLILIGNTFSTPAIVSGEIIPSICQYLQSWSYKYCRRPASSFE